MGAATIAITVIYIILCIVMVLLILSQEGKQQGLGTIAGTGTTDTYWSKIKSHTKEGILPRATAALATGYILISLLANTSVFQ